MEGLGADERGKGIPVAVRYLTQLHGGAGVRIFRVGELIPARRRKNGAGVGPFEAAPAPPAPAPAPEPPKPLAQAKAAKPRGKEHKL